MAKVQNGEEILMKVSTPSLGRMNVTDDRRICDSKDRNVMRSSKTLRSCLTQRVDCRTIHDLSVYLTVRQKMLLLQV